MSNDTSREEFGEFLASTYIQNWTPELHVLSIPTQLVPISKEEKELMCKLAWEGAQGMDENYVKETMLGIEQRITNAAVAFLSEEQVKKQGFFARLGSRSPKDAWFFKPPYHTGKEVLSAFLDSERIFDDFVRDINDNRESFVVIRPFLQIPKEREFRCIVQNGRLIGISQYFYDEKLDWIIENSETIQHSVSEIIQKAIKASGLSNVVIDVFLDADLNGRVLEINPYFDYTDPCLFTWKEIHNWTEETVDFRYLVRTPKNEEDQMGLESFGKAFAQLGIEKIE